MMMLVSGMFFVMKNTFDIAYGSNSKSVTIFINRFGEANFEFIYLNIFSLIVFIWIVLNLYSLYLDIKKIRLSCNNKVKRS